jgi:hypothetical protein
LTIGRLAIAAYRRFHVLARERIVALVPLAAVLPIGADLDGVRLLVITVAMSIAGLVVDHLRIEGSPA